MGFYYNVAQGDTLPRIAKEQGFNDYQTVWNDPNNAELKSTRPNPNVLAVGDRIYIPNKNTTQVSVATGTASRFRLNRRLPHLRLCVMGLGQKPMTNADCTLTIDGNTLKAKTNAQGIVDIALAADAEQATLEISGQTYTLKIGHLDPIDLRSGLVARLRNMGYLVDTDDTVDNDAPHDVDRAELKFAIELFQRDHQLPVDGDDTSQVLPKLQEIYGC